MSSSGAGSKSSSDAAKDSSKFDEVVAHFDKIHQASPHTALAVAAIEALTHLVKQSNAKTLMELEIELKAACDRLKAVNKGSISLGAGCELFSRYVTRTSFDFPDFEACKERVIVRGEQFAKMSINGRKTISGLVDRFISDGKVILIHGNSRVVSGVLLHAAQKGKHFSVIVTEGRPDSQESGLQAASVLSDAGIPVSFILDSSVAYVMERVDLVLVGAEGVVENGGIINKIGTYQIAIVAKAMKKPVYVAAESYKFARLFPLNQNDLPESKEDQKPMPSDLRIPERVLVENPRCDFTPPEYITLLFTDLGILTPSAVSDELIKLYA